MPTVDGQGMSLLAKATFGLLASVRWEYLLANAFYMLGEWCAAFRHIQTHLGCIRTTGPVVRMGLRDALLSIHLPVAGLIL